MKENLYIFSEITASDYLINEVKNVRLLLAAHPKQGKGRGYMDNPEIRVTHIPTATATTTGAAIILTTTYYC